MNRRFTIALARISGLLALFSLLAIHVVRVDARSTSEEGESGGLLRIVAVDGESDSELPVRIRVIPARLLSGEQLFHEASGRLELPLSRGEYRIVVSHGPAFSIYDRRVEIAAGETTSVRAALVREVDFAGYIGCDLHLHTNASPDSDLSVSERVETLLAEDLSLGVLTDHNHVTDVGTAERGGLTLLAGVEVTTWDPEFGHFNAFPLREAPVYRRTSERELLTALRRQPDVFVQINHPRLETHIGYFELNGFRGETEVRPPPHSFDGIEVWNGYELAAPSARQAVFLDWLAWNERGGRAVATGGSDSHKRQHAPRAGYPRTYVRTGVDGERPERAIAVLKAGAAFVTNGPLIELEVNGARSGEELSLQGTARALHIRVRVAAPSWMELDEVEIWLGTERVETIPLARAPGEKSKEVRALVRSPASSARTVVATVSGRGSMERLLGEQRSRPYAFTNPVWLERR